MQHHLDHFAPVCAERHAKADLVRPLRNFVGGHAVKSDRRKHQRDDPEQARQAGDGALLIERAIDLLLQRPDDS